MSEIREKKQGMLFDIQRFSIHDGPGIRTTVFLKGCTLRCFWCHNPESINPKPQLMVFRNKCIGCKACIQICPMNAHYMKADQKVFERERCNQCGKCASVCYSGALELSGKWVGVSEIIDEVEKDKRFYENSGGGVTFSGGEPLMQKEFLKELLKESKVRGLHTAVETAGNVAWEAFEMILPYTDLFLYDLKVMNPVVHKEVVGADNRNCLSHLQKLMSQKIKLCIRVPVITGVNDTKESMVEIRDFVAQAGYEI
ncbi:MAG: glycyl-radical enzyme activating protein, partial [Cellulosilyticaceae bacterium]